MDGINAAASKAQTFVFVLALSIHSFLEGMGMATKNQWGSLVSFLVSLFAHKWLEAFALGTGVAKACFPAWHSFWLIFVYAALTPAGIILGMWMDTASQSVSGVFNAMTRQVLDGLALGSFLFVSCIEMIPSEFHKKNRHAPYKFFVLSLGFAAMAAISLLHFH
jgi:zinc transporter 1/2/3